MTPFLSMTKRARSHTIPVGSVGPGYRAFGSESARWRSFANATWQHAPSTEMPSNSAMLAKFGKDFVVERHLIAANRAPIRRIKREDDRLFRQIRQRQHLVGR